jgi:hypothetical protein
VDDILCCSENPKAIMDHLGNVYTLKAGSVKEPDVYLGADITKFAIGVDQSALGISPDSYCKTAVTEVERKLAEVGKKLATAGERQFWGGPILTSLGIGLRRLKNGAFK